MGQRHRQSSRSLKPPVGEFVHRLVLLVIGTSIAYRTKAAAAALLHLYPEHLINLYSVSEPQNFESVPNLRLGGSNRGNSASSSVGVTGSLFQYHFLLVQSVRVNAFNQSSLDSTL